MLREWIEFFGGLFLIAVCDGGAIFLSLLLVPVLPAKKERKNTV